MCILSWKNMWKIGMAIILQSKHSYTYNTYFNVCPLICLMLKPEDYYLFDKYFLPCVRSGELGRFVLICLGESYVGKFNCG